MRHRALPFVFVLLLCSPLFLHAQVPGTVDTAKGDWYQQYPGLDFTEPQNFYAANSHTLYILFKGYLLRSSDAGVMWEKRDLPGCFTVNEAQFLNDTLGWLVGDKGAAYKTTDGGNTWIYVQTDWSAVDFRYVSFCSPTVGYISGYYSIVLKTTDGGDTWIPQNYYDLETIGAIAYVKAINDSVAWVMQYHAEGPDAILLYVHFTRTTDGGSTWNDTRNWVGSSGDTYRDFSDVVFCSADEASFYFGSWKFETQDGGITWDSTNTGYIYAVDSVRRFPDMFSCTTGWGTNTGGNIVFRATNADSLVWVQRNTPLGDTLITPIFYDFIDLDTGWCIREIGDSVLAVYQTTDGAQTWHVMSTHSIRTGSLQDVCFINPDTGWAVGTHGDGTGIVMHTTNSGGDWNVINSSKNASPMNDLHQVQFIDTLKGWALGDSIYQTTDGGVTWNVNTFFPLDSTRPDIKYIRVQFVDSLTGWVVRSDWLTYRTTNGGATWGLSHLADTSVDITIGKAVGENTFVSMGLLDSIPYEFRIIDADGHWQEFQIMPDTTGGGSYPSVPVVLTFLDTTRGWFMDANTDIFYTQNKGLTWKFLSGLNAWSPPTGACFVDTSDGWLLSTAKPTYGDPFTGDSINISPPGIIELTGDMTSGIPQGCIQEQMNGITFLGDSLGWAVGENLAIYHYYVPESARPHYAPMMVLSTPGLDFGTVRPGSSVIDSFIVYNQGTAPLYLWGAQIQNDSLDAFITVNILTGDSSARIMPGDSLIFTVAFNPQIAMPYYSTLYIYSNADTQLVRLK
ncbi:MAG TPA: YCF48-related protein, partial [Candidatus Kapabacteria bacterium]|nr:YCF48-related protein [Candidatus Kapabacteria bacterium]